MSGSDILTPQQSVANRNFNASSIDHQTIKSPKIVELDGDPLGENDASTMRTELSTDIEDASVHQRFNFSYTSPFHAANGAPSASHASSFESSKKERQKINLGVKAVSSFASGDSFDTMSHMTKGNNAYGASLLDLDFEDPAESVGESVSREESGFIGAISEFDTESRVDFYRAQDVPYDEESVPEPAKFSLLSICGKTMFSSSGVSIDTESQPSPHKQSMESLHRRRLLSTGSMYIDTDNMLQTQSRSEFYLVQDSEVPPSCREKLEQPFDWDDDDGLHWLTEETMKMEAKRKGNNGDDSNGDINGRGISNIRDFISRCGDCFSPP